MLPPLLELLDIIAERFFASLRFEQRGKQNQLGIQLEQFCLEKIEPEKKCGTIIIYSHVSKSPQVAFDIQKTSLIIALNNCTL